MNLGIESETLEFKKTTGELDKAMDNIASMLNKHGHGTLYFGVSPNGDVTGQQVSASSLNDVAKRIKHAIKPMIYPEIKEEVFDGRNVIRVDFTGTEKPYSSFGLWLFCLLHPSPKALLQRIRYRWVLPSFLSVRIGNSSTSYSTNCSCI